MEIVPAKILARLDGLSIAIPFVTDPHTAREFQPNKVASPIVSALPITVEIMNSSVIITKITPIDAKTNETTSVAIITGGR